MTIQEAIKSGKSIKRKAWVDDAWMFFEDSEGQQRFESETLMYEYRPYHGNYLNCADILADDWEIKQ